MSNNASVKKYIAYVRKSDEREEKQVLSLNAQKEAIRKQFPDLNIVEVIEEARSAFKPYNRPGFERAIKMLEKGQAEGLLAWHPNRLSRNEIDAATVTYMLRKSKIYDLRFCSYSFENTPEGIMFLQIIMGQSQYESSKLAVEVRRGMRKKASGGERPGSVALGYMKVPVLDKNGEPIMHAKETKFITKTTKDPERYDLVKRMWTMLLSGSYSTQQIRRIANEDWGFRTKPIKKKNSLREGNRPIGHSQIYRLFSNPFYAGWLVHEGEWSKGDHEAMITLEEYDYVQELLGDKGKPREGTWDYAYTGLIVCGECGCSIVGKHRARLLKGEKKVVHYIYYHCTRKSIVRACNQVKYTKVEDMEAEVDAELEKYTILPEFMNLAIDILNRNHKLEVKERNQIYRTQQTRRNEIQNQIDELIGMRTKGHLDDEEYSRSRNKLKLKLIKIDEKLRGTEERAEDWLELTERAFNFATYARVHFQSGSPQQKREILMTLGQNLMLKDGKLSITPNEWLVPIGNGYKELENLYLKGRTKQKATTPDREMAIAGKSDYWRAIRDSNPGHPA